MAIIGIFTSAGLAKTIEAQNNEGFKIFPETFSISRDFGVLNASRTTENAGKWFEAPISGRNVVDQNTIKIICTIPPDSSIVKEDVREVCIFGKDNNGYNFLLAVGQATDDIVYDPTGTVTLELQISLADIDLTSTYVFKNTKVAELEEHATDPNAHPEVVAILARYGIFIDGGAYAKERMGQQIEYPVQFDGTKASFVHAGVTFEATYNGDELNGITVEFDGTKTVDEVRADFNAIHYPNTIEHNGIGSTVLPANVRTLAGGSYNVDEKDVVYKDVDGILKQAIADGSIKSRVAGYALRAKKTLVGGGFADINTGYPANTPVYLSGDQAGKLTNFNTNVSMGVSLGEFIYFTGYAGDVSATVTQNFDAVVTHAMGAGQFSRTQDAINYVPNNGRILISKIEDVKQAINTNGKSLSFVFNGPNTGWRKFLGQPTVFRVKFDSVPTQGTWRMEYLGQESNDMPFDANALTVETEFNLFSGHNGFTVFGNFTDGFTFVSNDFQVYSMPTFTYAGRNEIQRFEFSNVPNDGTVTFSYDGQTTLNFPWDDDAHDLYLAFSALSNITNVEVTGSFQDGFEIEFKGGWLQDGNKEQELIKVIECTLDFDNIITNVNGTTIMPIDAQVVQKGKKPASNLYNGTTPLTITTELVQVGEEVGEDRLMNIDSPIMSITGHGVIEGFKEGLVVQDANTVLELQVRAVNTDLPVLSANKLPTVNYDIEVPNYAKDVFAQLKLTEHPTNKKRAVVSGVDFKLPSGSTLAKSLDGLKAKFDGAEIDFSLGKVFATDGITDLGFDFTPPTINPTMWKWFAVCLMADGLDAVTNQALARVEIIEGPHEGATRETAGLPDLIGTPVGMVAIRGALGNKEKTVITTTKDEYGSLKGKTLKLFHPTESVAFWFSDPSLDTFSVKKENLVESTSSDLFDSSQTRVLASKIVLSSNTSVNTVYAWLKKTGNPTGNMSVRVIGSTGGVPNINNVIAVSSDIDTSKLPLDFTQPTVSEFSSQIINAGTYFIELNASGVNIPAGSSISLNSDVSGTSDIYNRSNSDTSFSTTLGNRFAHVALVDRIKGYPALALTASRNVEITDLIENDFQQAVASKLFNAINADSLFSATLSGNKLEIENTVLGDVQDADMGTTGFFAKIITQGTDTDVTGIESILNENIIQLGGNAQGPAGPTGPKGAKGTTPFTESLLLRLHDSYFNRVTPCVFELDEGDDVIQLTTAILSNDLPVSYEFQNGDSMLTKNLMSVPSLAEDFETKMVEVHARWDIVAVDDNATYELALDGVNFNAVAMERHGESGTFYGRLSIPTPPSAVIWSNPTGTVTELDDTSEITHGFTLAQKTKLASINFTLNKVGNPDGFYTVVIKKGSAVIFQNMYPCSALVAGANTVNIPDVKNLLIAGNYTLTIGTSPSYKDSFVTGSNAISHNGNVQIRGHVYDLRLKITASADDVRLEGFGVFYEEVVGNLITFRPPTQERVSFSGNSDVTDFLISMFTPDADKLKIFDVTSGQCYIYPAFSVVGNTVKFPDGTFLVPNQTITLLFEQQ